jgi:hypothetical protein
MADTGVMVHTPSDPGRPGHHVVAPQRGSSAAHSARPRGVTLRLAGAVAGVAAVATAVGLGTAALFRTPAAPVASTLSTARYITVSAPPAAIPLTGPQIVGLLAEPPDFGALSDRVRLASCLTGLGYPASTSVLGATPVAINSRPAVLLVLAGEHAGTLTALAVAPNCSSADTGFVADTTMARP